MKEATIVFLIDENSQGQCKICLAMKKRGFGAGKWNGAGGKRHEGESLEQTAMREAYEEIGVTLISGRKCAELEFEFPHDTSLSMNVHVWLVNVWDGDPTESEEMRPKWFLQNEIPYEEMWQDDKYWLPLVLNGKFVTGKFVFDRDDTVLRHELSERPLGGSKVKFI